MKALAKTYTFIEKLIPGILFVSIFIVMLLEIASRHIFNKSFEWNTEYCRYALVWVTFIGAVYVRRENSHIEVAALYDFLKGRKHYTAMFILDLIRSIVSLGFWFFLAYYGHILAKRTANFTSSAMDISQYWLYISSSICGVLGLIMETGTFIRLFTKGSPGAKPPVENSVSEGEA